MAGTVKGSPDGPRYIYGKLNVNYQGSQRASDRNATSGSKESAKSDFPDPNDPVDYQSELIPLDEADLGDALSEINFDDTDSNDDDMRYREPHVITEDNGHRVLIDKNDDEVTMIYEFEDDPRSSILSMLDGGVDQAEELEYDPFGSDEDVITDEYYEAYDAAMQNFANREGLGLDQDVIENDYGRMEFYSSVDVTEDPDMTLEQLHDRFNGVYNDMTYVRSQRLRDDFSDELQKRGISTGDLAERLKAMRAEE